MTAKSEPTRNVHQRILAVMADVDYVAKGEKQVAGQYKYVSHDAVTATLHPMFVKHGIIALPNVQESVQCGNRTEVKLLTSFVNVDNPDDAVHIASIGYGIDPQDKGPGKAISYAYKYALLKLFALETGDDPERDSIDLNLGSGAEGRKVTVQRGKAKEKPQEKPQETPPGAVGMIEVPVKNDQPDWKGWAASIKAAINETPSVEDVNALMAANEAPLKNLGAESATALKHLTDAAAKRHMYLSQAAE